MPLTKLQFKPGIISDITSYSNEGGFVDGDKVRFRFGFPEKFGGWSKYTSSTYQGCLLYTSPSPRDRQKSRMPSSA